MALPPHAAAWSSACSEQASPNRQPLKELEPSWCLASHEGARRTLIICFKSNLAPNFSLISPDLVSPITNFTVIQSSRIVVCFFFKLFHTLSGWGGKENGMACERKKEREEEKENLPFCMPLCLVSSFSQAYSK